MTKGRNIFILYLVIILVLIGAIYSFCHARVRGTFSYNEDVNCVHNYDKDDSCLNRGDCPVSDFSNMVTNTLNVVDYEANGTDQESDTLAFQRALDEGINNEELVKIIVPNGTYYIDKMLAIYSNTILSLEDEAIIKISLDFSDNYVMFGSFANLDGVRCNYLERKMVDGKLVFLDDECNVNGGEYNQWKNIIIEGGTWDFNGTKYGIRLNHGENLIIRNIIFMNTKAAHVINVSGAKNVLITNNTFKDQSQHEDDMDRVGQTNEFIHIDPLSATSEANILLEDGTPVRNLLVEKNIFLNVLSGIGSHRTYNPTDELGNTGVAISSDIYDSQMGEEIVIRNNYFNQVHYNAINILFHKDVMIYDNTSRRSDDYEANTFVYTQNTGASIYNNCLEGFKTSVVIGANGKQFLTNYQVVLDGNIISGKTDSQLNNLGLGAVNRYFVVEFDSNGGTGSMSNQNAKIWDAIAVNKFSKVGYRFVGWKVYYPAIDKYLSIKNDGTGLTYRSTDEMAKDNATYYLYSNGDLLRAATQVHFNEHIRLIAQWKSEDVYDVVLFTGQSNMVGSVGCRKNKSDSELDGEDKFDSRVSSIGVNSFANMTGIDRDIVNNYTAMNHVNVDITDGTVYEYLYGSNTLNEITASTATLGEILRYDNGQVINGYEVRKDNNNNDYNYYALNTSCGINIISQFGKDYYAQTGHKLIAVFAAHGGQPISSFMPYELESINTYITNGQTGFYIYETMVEKYRKAIAYLEENDYKVGKKFYVMFQGETDAANVNNGRINKNQYYDNYMLVHNSLKDDLNLEFGVLIETSRQIGTYTNGVNEIHEAQEELILDNADIILGSNYSYRNYVPEEEYYEGANYIEDLEKAKLSVAISPKCPGDSTCNNMIHFHSAALSQIGKEAAVNTFAYLDMNEVNSFKLSSASYYLDYDKMIISKIKINDTPLLLEKNINYYGNILYLDKNNSLLQVENVLKTGDKVRTTLGIKKYDYILSVDGDVDGDGRLSKGDANLTATHIIDKNIINGDEYLLAADYNNDGDIKVNDVIKVLKNSK